MRRRLTVRDRAERWAETTRAIEGLKALQKEDAAAILEHAMKTGKRSYYDQAAVVRTGGSLVLNQEKVRAELGDRLKDFMTRTKLGWTLKLLQ